MNGHEHYNYLPQYAKVAIERLNNDNAKRNKADLAMFLDLYAQTYGTTCDPQTLADADYICSRRFWDYSA